MSESFVYCIGDGAGMVKVGRTNNLKRRIIALQTGSTARLRLMGVIEGGASEEARIHQEFSDRRIAGEWFRDHGGVIAGRFGPPPAEPFKPVGREGNAASPLGAWLGEHGVRQKRFAEHLGISRAHMSEMVGGIKQPSLELAHAIEQATDGGVPIASWLKDAPTTQPFFLSTPHRNSKGGS